MIPWRNITSFFGLKTSSWTIHNSTQQTKTIENEYCELRSFCCCCSVLLFYSEESKAFYPLLFHRELYFYSSSSFWLQQGSYVILHNTNETMLSGKSLMYDSISLHLNCIQFGKKKLYAVHVLLVRGCSRFRLLHWII